MRLVWKRDIDRSIDSMPCCLPRVQTLVAKNNLSRRPSLAASVPITCSERPYIGDESMTRPPSFTKSDKTSLSCFSFWGVESTSNTCQEPSPTEGIHSPDDGIIFAPSGDVGASRSHRAQN